MKHAAVKLLKAELPWQLVAAGWLPEAEALVAQQRLRALMPAFAYAHCVPFGHEPMQRATVGVLLRAAAHEPAGDELLAQVEATLGIVGGKVLRYADARRGQRRAMRLAATDTKEAGGATLDAFLLAGDAAAAAWVLGLLQDGLPVRAFGHALLSGRATPPSALPPRAPQVCNCLDVNHGAIVDALAHCHGDSDTRLAQLQQRLACGTQCGSCLPAVRALIAAQGAVRAPTQAAA